MKEPERGGRDNAKLIQKPKLTNNRVFYLMPKNTEIYFWVHHWRLSFFHGKNIRQNAGNLNSRQTLSYFFIIRNECYNEYMIVELFKRWPFWECFALNITFFLRFGVRSVSREFRIALWKTKAHLGIDPLAKPAALRKRGAWSFP